MADMKKYPELDDESRQKFLDRQAEENKVISEEETLRLSEYVKNLNKTVSLEKMLKHLGFPIERTRQVYLVLRNSPELNLMYRKGEWFVQKI